MQVRLKLFPPLSDEAGTTEMTLEVDPPMNIRSVVEALSARYGLKMRRHLFDENGRIIPSWAVFLNQKIVPLNQPQALEIPVSSTDEVSFILNIAGG